MDRHRESLTNPTYTLGHNAKHPHIGSTPTDTTMTDQTNMSTTYQGARPKQNTRGQRQYNPNLTYQGEVQTPNIEQTPRFSTPIESNNVGPYTFPPV